MDADDLAALRDLIATTRARTVRQIELLEAARRSIIDAAELTSTDDEHDPEGATIAYERAQAIALLRQAREDLGHLDETTARLDGGGGVACVHCGRPIPLERLMTLPTARRCVACAS